MKKLKKVAVTWEDAGSLANWLSEGETLSPFIVESVGHLMENVKSHILISQTFSPRGSSGGNLRIPKSLVRKIKTLR